MAREIGTRWSPALLFLVLCCFLSGTCRGENLAASVGVLVRLHGLSGEYLGVPWARLAAAAVMAVHHVNTKNSSLVPNAAALIPDNFALSAEIRDSESSPSVSIGHMLDWSNEGRDIVVGSYRSAVTGPMSLAASVSSTPVVSWGSTSSSLADESTYPTLSRVIHSDAVLSFGVVQLMETMRWRRIAIIHIDDAWGTAFAQDTSKFAEEAGIEVAASRKFFGGDAVAIDEAVRSVAASDARIILVLVFDSDMPVFIDAAEQHGLLQPGYVILSSDGFDAETVLTQSTDRQKTVQQMSGWFLVSMNPMHGARGDRFNAVLHSEPIEHLRDPLFQIDEETVSGGSCNQFCPLIYDAIWAAAIAKSQAQTAENGAVDKDDMLFKLRGLDFQGASGSVNFETSGERGVGDIPMVVSNLQPGTSGSGTALLNSQATWIWTQVSGLQRESTEPPIWIGGERTWTVPVTGGECDDGLVFSPSTFLCEPCPPRTEEVAGKCVAYTASIGLFVRLRGLAGEQLGDDWIRLAAAAAMAVHHVNHRNASLVPEAAALLPDGFRLSVDFRDTESSPSVSIGHTLAWSDQGRDIVVGSYRSAVTGPMALAASVSNTPVLSWGATASSLADIATYPTLGRLVPSDAVVSQGMVRFMEAMEWTRIAILYLDDAWGRAFAQDTAFFASQTGINVATMQKFVPGDAKGIDDAVRLTKESLARILVILVFDSDMPVFIESAKQYGILQPGYVIISGEAFEPNAVVSQSAAPEQMVAGMSGWFRVSMNAMHGAPGDRFNEVLFREPLENLENKLFPVEHDVVRGGPCQQYCPLIYDSVWAAAIAASRAQSAPDGSLVKQDVLARLRDVSFEGASGDVVFDPTTGERGPSEIPMVIVNLQPGAGGDGEALLNSEVAWTWTAVSGLKRESSAPPLWLGGVRSWDDIPSDGASCSDGYIFSEVTLECVVCEAGKFQSGQQCLDCPAGSVSALDASTQCAPCQAGYQELEGQTECTPCPANSARQPASLGINVSECLCVSGYFRRGADGSACEECVTGATCPGGESMPHPLQGFWGDKDCAVFGFGDKECPQWDLFLECNPSANCVGGPEFLCHNGSKGNLCIGAEDGYSIIGSMFWWECGENGHAFTLLGMVSVLFVWFGINAVASGEYDALNVALLFLQITGLISSFGLRWHKNLEPLNVALNIANFDVDFVTPYCLFSWGPSMSFYLQLLLPFAFGCAYALYFAARKSLQRSTGMEEDKFGIKVQVMKSVVSFILIVYHTQVLKCFSAYRCTEFPDGRQFLTFAPEVECWESEHWAMVVTASLYIPVVLVGLPAFLVWEVVQHMRAGTLHTEEAMFRWGFMHQHYETDAKYWEAMIILRRLLIAVIAVIISEPMLQGACTMIVLTALLAAHTNAAPYVVSSVDVLDFASICGSMLYALAGLLMYPNLTMKSQNQVCVDGSDSKYCAQDANVKEAISIVTLCAVFLTLGVAAVLTYKFVREKRDSAQAARIIDRHCRKGLLDRGGDAEAVVDVADTVNKLVLEDMLEGTELLRWAKSLDDVVKPSLGTPTSRFLIRSPQLYPEVDSAIRAIPIDLTQYSDSPTTRILRAMCEIPGIIDFVAVNNDQDAQLNTFVEKLAHFVQKAEEHHAGRSFPMHDVVKFEHRPLILYFLMTGSRAHRRSWRTLLDGILVANNHGSTHSQDGKRDRRHSVVSNCESSEAGFAEVVESREVGRRRALHHNRADLRITIGNELERVDAETTFESGSMEPDEALTPPVLTPVVLTRSKDASPFGQTAPNGGVQWGQGRDDDGGWEKEMGDKSDVVTGEGA